ncbi:MAG: DUF3341 domain-containing protein [Desulfuromonadales bacterium]|nr:DUF3341 domain-containing protein [Desulfuromonadales bacterium]
MELLGVFASVEQAAAAVDRLVQAGYDQATITSVTSVPYPPGVFVHTQRRSWLHWVTAGGALLGAGAGFALAAGTAWLYPVQTGDKPIVALFPTGIIAYEFMMLCALLGTMIGMFLEMGLPEFKRRAYDPEIANGLIGIAVTFADETQRHDAEQALYSAGALRIRTDEAPA